MHVSVDWMAFVLRYFDFCGYCSEFKTHKRQRNYAKFILILHCIIGIFATFSIVQYLRLWSDDRLGTLIDIVRLFGVLFVYLSSIIELYSKRRYQNEFWKIYRNIDMQFCRQQGRIPRNYLWTLLYIPTVSMFYVIHYAYVAIAKRNCYFFGLTYSFIILMYQNRVFYYLLYLNIVETELQIIGQEVNQFNNVFQMKTDSKLTTRNCLLLKFNVDRLKWIREYYRNVHGLCECINETFGWSNFLTIINSFTIIVSHLNWIYWRYFNATGVFLVKGKKKYSSSYYCPFGSGIKQSYLSFHLI